MYPIQNLITEIMKEKHISRHKLVEGIGYRNIIKGCRYFDKFMNENIFHEFISVNIHKALNVSASDIAEKLKETETIIKAEQDKINRESFVPFLLVRTENTIPSQITICALCGFDRLKEIPLGKDFNKFKGSRQNNIIIAGIQKSVSSHNGIIPTFGKILSFILHRYYDEPAEDRIVFDLKGRKIRDADSHQKRTTRGKAMVKINGKDSTRIIQNQRNIY